MSIMRLRWPPRTFAMSPTRRSVPPALYGKQNQPPDDGSGGGTNNGLSPPGSWVAIIMSAVLTGFLTGRG